MIQHTQHKVIIGEGICKSQKEMTDDYVFIYIVACQGSGVSSKLTPKGAGMTDPSL